jgi:hypothetical protein
MRSIIAEMHRQPKASETHSARFFQIEDPPSAVVLAPHPSNIDRRQMSIVEWRDFFWQSPPVAVAPE